MKIFNIFIFFAERKDVFDNFREKCFFLYLINFEVQNDFCFIDFRIYDYLKIIFYICQLYTMASEKIITSL